MTQVSEKTAVPAKEMDPSRHPDRPEEFQGFGQSATRAFAVAFALISLVLLLLLPVETSWLKRVKLYQQPAFWPAISLGIMVLFSFGYAIQTMFKKADVWLEAELKVWVQGLEYVAWFMAYVWCVPRLGYLPVTALFAAALTWRVGYRNRQWMLIAAAFGASVVVVFKSILGVNIPAGEVYDALPAGGFRSFLMTNF